MTASVELSVVFALVGSGQCCVVRVGVWATELLGLGVEGEQVVVANRGSELWLFGSYIKFVYTYIYLLVYQGVEKLLP
jgi:hypothetical protein